MLMASIRSPSQLSQRSHVWNPVLFGNFEKHFFTYVDHDFINQWKLRSSGNRHSENKTEMFLEMLRNNKYSIRSTVISISMTTAPIHTSTHCRPSLVPRPLPTSLENLGLALEHKGSTVLQQPFCTFKSVHTDIMCSVRIGTLAVLK